MAWHRDKENNKHLMTGHKGNSEFCFPETLNVPRGEAEGNIEVEGKQNSLFPEEPVIKCFVILPDSKIEKARKIERLPKPTCSIEKSR